MGILSKIRNLIAVLSLMLIFSQLILLSSMNNDNPGQVAGLTSKSERVVVTANVGGRYFFTIYGYTSPHALVELEGSDIAESTYADVTGYFEFHNQYSPLIPREVCLNAKDQFGRTSAPACLPPFPTQYNTVIGPVIIPPTLSLDKPDYYTGDEVILTGQSLPEADISLSMFTQPSTFQLPILSSFFSSMFPIIKPVNAFSLPNLNTKSDSLGNFSISLPSSSAQNYRLFTQVDFQDLPSANSHALSLKILPIWMIIISFFTYLWSLLAGRTLEMVIFLEILILSAYLIRIFFTPYYISRRRAIIKYRTYLPAIEEKHPLMLLKALKTLDRPI